MQKPFLISIFVQISAGISASEAGWSCSDKVNHPFAQCNIPDFATLMSEAGLKKIRTILRANGTIYASFEKDFVSRALKLPSILHFFLLKSWFCCIYYTRVLSAWRGRSSLLVTVPATVLDDWTSDAKSSFSIQPFLGCDSNCHQTREHVFCQQRSRRGKINCLWMFFWKGT